MKLRNDFLLPIALALPLVIPAVAAAGMMRFESTTAPNGTTDYRLVEASISLAEIQKMPLPGPGVYAQLSFDIYDPMTRRCSSAYPAPCVGYIPPTPAYCNPQDVIQYVQDAIGRVTIRTTAPPPAGTTVTAGVGCRGSKNFANGYRWEGPAIVTEQRPPITCASDTVSLTLTGVVGESGISASSETTVRCTGPAAVKLRLQNGGDIAIGTLGTARVTLPGGGATANFTVANDARVPISATMVKSPTSAGVYTGSTVLTTEIE